MLDLLNLYGDLPIPSCTYNAYDFLYRLDGQFPLLSLGLLELSQPNNISYKNKSVDLQPVNLFIQ